MTYLFFRAKLFMKVQSFPSVKNLRVPLIGRSGRSNTGQITFQADGSRVYRNYRLVDFKRFIWYLKATILRVEYDPNRSSFIALICYANGILSYINATEGVFPGKRISMGDITRPRFMKLGNTFPIHCLNEGSIIHTVEVKPNFGGILARSAGTSITILKQLEGNLILAKLPSKEEIVIDTNCIATLGRNTNIDRKFFTYYKAGQLSNLGVKPKVRGVAKNPVDHPHGGGGGRCLVTPWAKVAKNRRTRNKLRVSKQIVRSRRLFIRKVFVKKLKEKSKRV